MNYKQHHLRKTKKRSGFVMIEALVAMTLILLTIPAALTVVTRSISVGSDARDQMIASYLAQEGLEIIRNRRDSNMIENVNDTPATPVDWMEGFAAPGPDECRIPGLGCKVDAIDLQIEECSGSCSPTANFFRLNIITSGSNEGLYTHTAGTATKFYRRIIADRDGGPGSTQVTVRSTVTWNTHFGQRQITVSEILKPWYQ